MDRSGKSDSKDILEGGKGVDGGGVGRGVEGASKFIYSPLLP